MFCGHVFSLFLYIKNYYRYIQTFEYSLYCFFFVFQAANGKLPADRQPLRIKLSGDGARMTRLTKYVILSYCLLDKNEDIFCVRGMPRLKCRELKSFIFV